MLNIFKKIVYLCLFFFLLALTSLILFMILVKPNDYKASISQKLTQITHRKVNILGDINWTFYPVLGISVHQIEIDKPFLSVDQVAISVHFLPLLRKEISIDRIMINHLALNLTKKNNNVIANQTHHTEHTQDFIKNNKANVFNDFKISLLEIKNSEIIYRDQQANRFFAFQKATIVSHDVAINKSFLMNTTGFFKTNYLSEPVNISFTGQLFIDKNLETLAISQIIANTNQYHWHGFTSVNLRQKDLSGLNGQLTVSGNNGIFHGIDVDYYSHVADALIHKTQPTAKNTHQTSFKALQASMQIKNGLIRNQDFTLQADKYDLSGQGDINLVTQQIDYALALQRLTTGTNIKPRGPVIPIKITGLLTQPDIRPDWEKFLFMAIKDQLSEKIHTTIQQGLQKLQTLIG